MRPFFLLAAPLLAGAVAQAEIAETVTAIGALDSAGPVVVAGVIDRILDEDEFRLADATGAVRVYIGPNQIPAPVGAEVVVRGRLDDGWPREIYAREMTLPNGETVAFDLRY